MKIYYAHDRRMERGQVSIYVVIVMGTVLLGFLGFASDYTNFWHRRQAAQGAADATCQAGAMDLLLLAQGQATPTMNFTPSVGATVDCASSSTAAPCIIAKYNGYDATVAGKQVVMTFPATVGGNVGPTGVAVPFIKVDVTEQVPRYFSRILAGNTTVNVHASASCGLTAPAGPVPIVVLHRTKSNALSVQGTPTIGIIGGPRRSIQVNSSSSSAVNIGGSATVDLTQAGPGPLGGDLATFGGPATAPGGFLTSTPPGKWRYPAPPLSDPFQSVPEPVVPGTNGTKTHITYSDNGTCPDPFNGCDVYSPGKYPSGIQVKSPTPTAIFLPGLYYVGSGGLQLAANSTVRVSSSDTGGDTTGGVVFYFTGPNTLSVDSNSGKSPRCTSNDPKSGKYQPNNCVFAYRVDGTADPLSGVTSRALQCPGGAANPPSVPNVIDGNVLLGACSGPSPGQTQNYGDPSRQYRGFLFYQDRSAAVNANWGGGGQFLLAGWMYFHQCRPDGAGYPCSDPGSGGYGTTFTLQGNSGAGAYTIGVIDTDVLNLGGTSAVNMILSPMKQFNQLKVAFLQ